MNIAGSGSPTCACRPINVNYFSLQEVPAPSLAHLVKLVSGRMPDQSNPSEVLASFNLATYGVHVGSVLHIPLVATSQRPGLLSGNTLTPHGPLVTVHVVGMAVSEFEFPSTSNQPAFDVYTTRAFARAYNPRTVLLYEYFVRLHPGTSGLLRFEAATREPRRPLRDRSAGLGHCDHNLNRPPGRRVVDPDGSRRARGDPRAGAGTGPPGRH